MRPFGVVVKQVSVEILLHGLHGLVPVFSPGDAEVLVEQGAVQTFDEAVALRPSHLGGAVFDALELQEQFVGVAVGPAAELASVVAQDGGDGCVVSLEEGQDVVVGHVHRRDRQFGGVEPSPGVAAVAVDDRLQVDAPDALDGADEEGIHRHQVSGVLGLDVAFAELGAEPFQGPHLFVREVELLLPDRLFQAQKALVFVQEVMAAPHPPDTTGGEIDARESQVLRRLFHPL